MRRGKKGWTALLVWLLCLSLLPAAWAEGSGNIDSGGGGMGTGSSDYYWANEDGIRISVMTPNGSVAATFDWTNFDESGVTYHFGKHTKMDYLSGYRLTEGTGRYISKKPTARLPVIVGGSAGSNLAAIRSYFTDTGHLRDIADMAGVSYDAMVAGQYKLLLEPIAYFVYAGVKTAATATEAALLNQKTSGYLHTRLGSLTAQNLPLALFLERTDSSLGLSKWTGSTTGRQSDANIVHYLGMGVVSFDGSDTPTEGATDYVFRCNTDVIVSFPIRNTGEDITPDDDAYVTLQIGGDTYHRQFICPAGETQLVWLKWHTPSTPVSFNATASGAGSAVTLHIEVERLEEKEPPDPTYYDKNEGFSLAATPNYGSKLTTNWWEWYTEWIQEHGQHLGGYHDTLDGDGNVTGSIPWYYVCDGYCAEHGHWEFLKTDYTASLRAEVTLSADDHCPTDYESNGRIVMGSGYGVQATVEAQVNLGTGVDSYDVTKVQNVVATFPEFGYETYDRFLERTSGTVWQFQRNGYSINRSRIHYTPLWYPDDTNYPVAFCIFDAWTPGGQLYASRNDYVYIFESCLDDWYIHLEE